VPSVLSGTELAALLAKEKNILMNERGNVGPEQREMIDLSSRQFPAHDTRDMIGSLRQGSPKLRSLGVHG